MSTQRWIQPNAFKYFSITKYWLIITSDLRSWTCTLTEKSLPTDWKETYFAGSDRERASLFIRATKSPTIEYKIRGPKPITPQKYWHRPTHHHKQTTFYTQKLQPKSAAQFLLSWPNSGHPRSSPPALSSAAAFSHFFQTLAPNSTINNHSFIHRFIFIFIHYSIQS